ncbi:hypothetical protein RFI_14585 [Reticulomyxa filosa]|uniref:Uncharacterized protein n=1 Tax=Reticulomyxa filosa TaxID=46433 RepID=X6NA23_RETFI|nr:hypothetical protein RFI_14585 [Reticulomyxa filosa]|eukprot:ETO22609.1 hypothetical protein RFI_14585 [Reticulomyxa filosa]
MLPGAEPKDLEALIDLAEMLNIPIWIVITRWSRSQPFGFYEQMMSGVRYFDLRCGWMHKWMQWVAFHGEAGQAISTLMLDVKEFLDEHPQEIVLIEASHLDGSPTELQKQWLVNNFTEIFGDYLLPVQSTYPTYGQMVTSGQRVFLSLDDSIVSNYNNIWPGTAFENTYADSAQLREMMQYNNMQVALFNANLTNSNSLFKISWTLTPQTATVISTVEPHSPHTLLVTYMYMMFLVITLNRYIHKYVKLNNNNNKKELAAVANAEMWTWASQQFGRNLRIGNIFLYDDYPTASIVEIINALYN